MNAETEIRARAGDLKRIDTHSHISGTLTDLREVAKGFEAFSTCQGQMDSRVTAEGCRELYGIDPGTYLRPDAPNDIFQRAEQLRSVGFKAALLSVLDEARISVQLAFCGLRPEDNPLLKLLRYPYLIYGAGCLRGVAGEGCRCRRAWFSAGAVCTVALKAPRLSIRPVSGPPW